MEEIWAKVKGFELYLEASNLGRIRTIDRIVIRCGSGSYLKHSAIVRPVDNGHGYKYVTMCVGGKRKNLYVHRAVALAFHPNNNNHPQVNHIDFDKTNNSRINLEWCTSIENVQHNVKNNRNAKGKNALNAIRVINKSSKMVFDTIKEAADYYEIKYGLLKEALRRTTPKRSFIYSQLMYLSDYNAEKNKARAENNPVQAKEMGLSLNRL